MKAMFLWLILMELLTGSAAIAAPAKVTLREVVNASSDIVVGNIIQRRRVWRIPTGLSPNYPYPSQPQYLCEFDIAVDHVLYSSSIRVGSQLSVLMFDFYANCSTPGRPDNPPRPSTFIWFLRQSGTVMRPSYDSPPAVRAIGRPTADDIRYAETFQEKEVRVGFLLLQKGIVSRLTGYEDHIFGCDRDVKAMCGMQRYLTIRAFQYRTDPSNEMRSQIDILLSSLGMCMARARVAVEQYKVLIEPRYSLLDPGKWQRWQEAEMAMLSDWKAFPEPENEFEKEALNGWLVAASCSSSRKVRDRARSVIRHLGRDELRSIQCVPCE